MFVVKIYLKIAPFEVTRENGNIIIGCFFNLDRGVIGPLSAK